MNLLNLLNNFHGYLATMEKKVFFLSLLFAYFTDEIFSVPDQVNIQQFAYTTCSEWKYEIRGTKSL